MRLDVYLQQDYPDISRASLQRLIKEGRVTVNESVQQKNSLTVKDSDAVKIDLDSEAQTPSSDLGISVLYEDKDCVVINKPIGVLTHSKGAFNPESTVASWLAERSGFDFKEDGVNPREGIVHRLDRATSGVMICAKNEPALKHLQKQFQDRKAKKTYVARVEKEVEPAEALINLPIERNPKQPQRFRVGQNGKPAQTKYRILETIQGKNTVDSILELNPLTGRTHQLRVHLEYVNHPIVGDTFYKGRSAKRLFLHAHKLEITLPNKERELFSAKVPDDFYEEDV